MSESANIKSYGAIGDGASHQLDTVTNFNGSDTSGWTLSQWQSILPQANDLSNELDNVVFLSVASQYNSIYFPAGNYQFNMLSVSGTISLFGDGYIGSILTFSESGSIEITASPSTTSSVSASIQNLKFVNNGNGIPLNINNTGNYELGGAGINHISINGCMFNGNNKDAEALIKLNAVNTSNISQNYVSGFANSLLAIVGESTNITLANLQMGSLPSSQTTAILIDGQNTVTGVQGLSIANVFINGGKIGVCLNANIDFVNLIGGMCDSCLFPLLIQSSESNSQRTSNVTISGWYAGMTGIGAWQANHTYTMDAFAVPTVSNGYQYLGTATDGGSEATSGSTEPAWPTSPVAL